MAECLFELIDSFKTMKLAATVWLKFVLPILIGKFPVFIQFQVRL